MNRFYFSQKQAFQIFLFGILLALQFPLFGQIQVAGGDVPPWTPETLISNVFLGDGVEVTNINYTGDANAVGYFTNGLADIGLERGIVMSTGVANTAVGDATGSETGETSGLCSAAACPDLTASVNNPAFNIHDAAKYEITFIPVSDTLRFRYVFASEEFLNFSCSSFNDVFGFYVTGPNPAGGNYVGDNIALVPDQSDPSGLTFTNNPVTINNVNWQGQNPPFCQFDNTVYYNDNGASTTFSFNGYLNVFTAQAIVTPCETYTIKLAIADVSDDALDTGVFLEAKSFGTGTLEVEAKTVSLDGTIVEGCSDGELCFRLATPAESDLLIDYNIIGTAINGVDYETIPLDMFIAQGETSVCVPIIAMDDNLAEPVETIGIDIQRDPCNRDTFYIQISDNIMVPPNLSNDTTICLGDSLFLDGTLPIPLPPPPTFSNTTALPLNTQATQNGVFSDINVFGVQPFELQENVIKSVCIDSLVHVFDDDVDIYLYAPGGQFIELTTDNGAGGDNYINTCFTPESVNEINVGPNNQAPASAAPFTGTYTPEGLFEDLWDGDSPSNGTWSLFLYDDANGLHGTLHSWTICFNPLYQLDYSWSPTDGLSCADCPDPIAKPTQTTTYVLTVNDSYGCSVQDSITVEVLDVLDAPVITCGTITNNSITFNWDDIGGTSYEVNVDGTGWVPASPGPLSHTVNGLLLNQSVTIEVRGISNCNGSIGTVTCMTPNCSPPTANLIDVSGTDCYGGDNGMIEVQGSGVNGPFAYTIDGSTAQPNGLFQGLEGGDYSIQVIDDLACAATIIVTVPEPDTLMSSELTIDSVSCFGFSDGQGTVTVLGGTPTANYSFLWSTGSTDSIATNLVVGENYVTITDGNGCSVMDTIMIEEPAILTASIMSPAVIECAGANTGEATVDPMGGTSPYNFDWGTNANNQNTATATALIAAELYIVTVTDANNCETLASVSLTENAPITFSNTSSTDASCNGINDGTATVTPAGGAGGFTYEWVDGQTTQMADTLTVGTFSVTVSDALGCTADTTVSISSPNAMLIGQTTMLTNCFDSSDGGVVLSPAGGTPGYTYAWSDGGAATISRNDLAGGNYQVTVTDANMCFEIVDVEIFTPSEMMIQLAVDNNVSCGGGADGSATVSGSGGAGGIDFVWSGGTNPMNPTVMGLGAGWVTVTATDANGCIKIDSIELTEPTPISLTSDSTDVTCNGLSTGTASVIASGGASNFLYQWDANANNQITPIASTLSVGTYTVTVTDGNNCEATIAVEVLEPPVLTVTATEVDAKCFGVADGESVVSPAGGTPNYAYEWSDGSIEKDRTDFVAGTYTVTVTDTNGCMATTSITIDSPTELTVGLTGIDIECFNQNTGSVTATANGGAGTYMYEWNDTNNQTTVTASNLISGTYTLTVTDANMCTATEMIVLNQPTEFSISNATVTDVDCNTANTGGVDITITGGVGSLVYSWTGGTTMEDLSSVVAGTYTVLVTDANMCTVQETYIIEEPDALSLNFNSTNVGCFMGNDGAIDVDVQGGAGNYSYLWTFPDGSTNTPEDLQTIEAGTYTVQVTDGNGCMISDMVTITQPATGVSLTMSPDDLICFQATDGTLTVTPSGGTAPYNYIWSDTNNQPTQTANNLPTGTYTVTVSDASNCTFTASAIVDQQPEITVNLSQDGASCHNTTDGSATIENIMLGNTPANLSDYTITWNTSPVQNSVSASGLDGGETYTVVVTNSLGCTASASIGIDQPAEVFAEIVTSTDVVCKDGSDGTATATGSGGTAPYTYAWNVGSQITETAISLQAGNYIVTVFDANGCTATNSVTINEPDALEIRGFDITDVTCKFGSTGSLTVTVEGGNSPYNYTWSNGFGIPTISDLSASNYSVTVSDINGCTVVGDATVREPTEELTGQIDFSDVTCFDGSDGQIFMIPEGGTPPYTYTIDGMNYNGSPTQLGLVAGAYPNVAILDANGCEHLFSPITISQPPAVSVNLGADTTIIFGEGLWIVPELNVSGNLTYDWSPADHESLNCNDCEVAFLDSLNSQTSFQLVVTDENGCRGSDIITVFVRKLRELLVPTAFSPNGDNVNDMLLVHGRKGSRVLSFQVFDRWGELVFEGGDFPVNDVDSGWDGTFKGQGMNPGIYVWQVEVEYEDGEKEVYKGSTTLIK